MTIRQCCAETHPHALDFEQTVDTALPAGITDAGPLRQSLKRVSSCSIEIVSETRRSGQRAGDSFRAALSAFECCKEVLLLLASFLQHGDEVVIKLFAVALD